MVIVLMQLITLFACSAALCAAEKPDECAVSKQIGPRFRRKPGSGLGAALFVMIRRHCGEAFILVASFTGGSILMFGP